MIRRHAGLCLKRVDLSRRFRLLGVRVGKLLRADGSAAPSSAAAHEPEPATDQLF